MKPTGTYNKLLINKLLEEFKSRNITGYYCSTKEDAMSLITDLIPEGSVISCGGSETIRELDARRILKAKGFRFLDPDEAADGQAKAEIARQALHADFYLMSCNAISSTGELVNLDGIGNRVAALSFGPKNVIIVAGINKITPDIDTAILRAKTIAAPMILLAFRQEFPSFDQLANAAEKSYSQMVVTERSVFKERIRVIIVGENLGF